MLIQYNILVLIFVKWQLKYFDIRPHLIILNIIARNYIKLFEIFESQNRYNAKNYYVTKNCLYHKSSEFSKYLPILIFAYISVF